MSTDLVAPPYDAELTPILDGLLQAFSPALLPSDIPMLRAAKFNPGADEIVAGRPIEYTTHTIAGPGGDLAVTVFHRADQSAPAPTFFFTHVGGLIFGDAFNGIAPLIDWVEQFGAVAVTVDYRLAPEAQAPAQLEDAYAALQWTVANASELQVDTSRLVVAGASAGGGLAAGLALKSRDENGPALAGQMLLYATLDDRNRTVSNHQHDGIGLWDRTSNDTAWDAALGSRRGTDEVTAYEAPSRAADLSGLPPAFVEVGSGEVFRDESAEYASGIWAAGGAAELHVWAGGFHLFPFFAPDTEISRAATAARTSWVTRTLGL